MNSAQLTKTEIKSLRIRERALTAELQDATCQKFPTAKAHVQAELNSVRSKLSA